MPWLDGEHRAAQSQHQRLAMATLSSPLRVCRGILKELRAIQGPSYKNSLAYNYVMDQFRKNKASFLRPSTFDCSLPTAISNCTWSTWLALAAIAITLTIFITSPKQVWSIEKWSRLKPWVRIGCSTPQSVRANLEICLHPRQGKHKVRVNQKDELALALSYWSIIRPKAETWALIMLVPSF